MSEQEKILTPSIEKSPNLETGSEETLDIKKVIEKPTPVDEETTAVDQTPATTPAPTPVPPEVERGAEIERILEQDLSDVYFNLPEDKREEFRVRGEQTAQEINSLMSSAKATAHRIVKLIKSWLLLIPGVNKFFLEQEAKLKADKIIKIKDRF